MDIGIITHYDVHNHGALLQLNAVVKVLKQKGYDAAALQFEKNYDFLGVELKDKYNISLRSIPYYIKYMFERGIRKTLFNVGKKRLLDGFKVQERLVGEYYTSYKDLKAVVVGSDEVFALHTGPTPAFFGHALPSDNIFAYAGCFGPTTIESIKEWHCEAFVKSGLENMTNISVRDKNSADIIRELIGIEATRVCDPVILYGYSKEIEALPKVNLTPYLLVYAYDNNMNDDEEVARIKAYAREKGLQIVCPGFYHKWCDKNINVDPVTLLSYFRDAECVVTDTFHGSVMSIITNTELAVHLRGNQNKLGNLLDEYGLTERIISENNSLDQLFTKQIDWNAVNNEVQRRRKISDNYLTESLKR